MMIAYGYATLYREPDPGAVPRQGLIGCEYEPVKTPSGRYAYGVAVYSRELTQKEIDDYELEFYGSR